MKIHGKRMFGSGKVKRKSKGVYKTFDEKYAIMKLDRKQGGKWGAFMWTENNMYVPLHLNMETLELAKQALKQFIQQTDPYYPLSCFD